MDLVFATNNEHKLLEIRKEIGDKINILSLKEIGFFEDIEETGTTLEENSLIKAKHIQQYAKKNCFADDTGLEIDVLNGEPGVYSARYAGVEGDGEKNMNKVLEKMKGVSHRQARFRTVITLLIKDEIKIFDGVVEGEIMESKSGNSGFGYDPIFRPKGYSKTFAELSLEVKNKISHRGIASRKLIAYLKENKFYK